VTATVNGIPLSWNGAIGLAPTWTGTNTLSTTDQEWVSACLAAHINLRQMPVFFSLRGDHTSLASTPSERASYNCREAAFMGNLFAGWETDPLPLTQCHEPFGQLTSGRLCDPFVDDPTCKVDCFAMCNPGSDHYSSCSDTVNGAARSYSHVITAYLSTNSSQGCLGPSYNVTSHSANYTSSGASWAWDWTWSQSSTSCSGHCGGYPASSTCSCTPDCASKGTCCSDYTAMCGNPQNPYYNSTISSVTSGQSTCPSGYTTTTGSLANVAGAVAYYPSSSGFSAWDNGTLHGTLLGSGSDFNLRLEQLLSGSWKLVAISERPGTDESLHYFYGRVSRTYRWVVSRNTGSGSYTLCTRSP
jgi:hypothetical protein